MDKVVLTSELIANATQKLRNHENDAFKNVLYLYTNHAKSSDYSLICELSIIYAKLLGYHKSNYKKSVEVINKAIKDARYTNSPIVLKAELDFFLGIFHHFLGDYVESFLHYHKAIEQYEKVENIKPLEEQNIANALINIGALCKLNDYEEYNKKDINRALQIYTKLNAKFGIANCYNLFATYAANKKNYKEAMTYYKKALTLNIELDKIDGIAICFSNIANIYSNLGKLDEAFSYLKKSYEKLELLKNDFLFALHDIFTAETYLKKKDFKKVITHYRKALDFFEDKEYKTELIDIYKGLADTYAATNQYKKAYHYLLKHNELKKSAYVFDKAHTLHKLNKKSI